VGICETSRTPPIVATGMPLINVGNTHNMVYCNVISTQFVGNDMICCLRTVIFPLTNCDNIFYRIYYVPVDQRKFQVIRIELLKTNGKRVPFKYRKIPANGVLHFRMNYHC